LEEKKDMKTLIVTMFMCAVAASAFATAQYPDKIVYEGKEYSLHTNPMDAFFTKNPDKKPKGGLTSTALWRGYVATFEFQTNSLILKDIEIQVRVEKEKGQYPYEWKSVIGDVGPKDETLQVDWFTGLLVLPHGNLVKYVHMGYESTYSNYILLEIKEGKLTDKRAFDHKQLKEFKKQQLQAFKETENYRKKTEELRSRNQTQEEIDSIIGHNIFSYISEFLGKEEKKEQSSNKDPEATR
jgi:hypothetical protein